MPLLYCRDNVTVKSDTVLWRLVTATSHLNDITKVTVSYYKAKCFYCDFLYADSITVERIVLTHGEAGLRYTSPCQLSSN